MPLCLLDCVTKVHKIVGKGDVVGVNYLQFQRVFDRLPHWGISKGTNNHRIKSNVMLRIKSQLNNRKQRVITNVLFLKIEKLITGDHTKHYRNYYGLI